MKTTILSGLTAIALGALTSCSNILEDNGINPGTKAETGLLSLNLNTDASVGVMTKAEGESNIFTLDNTITKDAVENELTITGKKDGTDVSLGKSSEYKNGATKRVEIGNYTEFTATYGTESDLKFNNPVFKGTCTTSVEVIANQTATTTPTIPVKLANSIIKIDNTSYGALTVAANLTKFEISVGDNKVDLLADNNMSKCLYVAANVKPMITIEGVMKEDSKPISIQSSAMLSDSETTKAAMNYKVTFDVTNDHGYLKLTINVNGEITEQIITIPVNPYETDSQS